MLAVSVGNEIPADVVRVHGIGAVEEGLSELVAEIHAADPELLATYTSFPTTEYLRVEGQDFASFNVFLESRRSCGPTSRRLQVVAGELPLVLTELGLAAGVHGEDAQADSLAGSSARSTSPAAPAPCVFSWTDEWGVAGVPVEGWGFGLTDAEREPKPALDVVRELGRAPARAISAARGRRVSVVVCAYNEERDDRRVPRFARARATTPTSR